MSNSLIKKVFEEGIRLRMAEGAEQEATKKGILRGGSSGILLESGSKRTIAGTCQRRAFLRKEGIEVEVPEPGRELMFAAGRSNEDAFYEALSRSWTEGPILKEEEVPVRWTTNNGTLVTGRPDLVLCEWKNQLLYADEQTKKIPCGSVRVPSPKVGIELKLVSSLWTARDVLFEGKPKYNHLIQAAHYSWRLGVQASDSESGNPLPFELWYVSRADFVTNDMANRCLPSYGTARWQQLQKHLDCRPYLRVVSKNGNEYGKQISWEEFEAAEAQGLYGYRPGQVYVMPLKILPFAVGYVLRWEGQGEEAFLTYESTELPGEVVKTEISVAALRAYYEFVSTMEEKNELGPRPLTLKGDGQPANFSQCNYCPLQATCNEADAKKQPLNEWLGNVRNILDAPTKKK